MLATDVDPAAAATDPTAPETAPPPETTAAQETTIPPETTDRDHRTGGDDCCCCRDDCRRRNGGAAAVGALVGLGVRPRPHALQPRGRTAAAIRACVEAPARIAGRVPTRRRRQHGRHADARWQGARVRATRRAAPVGQVPGGADGGVAGSERRARLRLVSRRLRLLTRPRGRPDRVALQGRIAHRVVAAARRRHPLRRDRGRRGRLARLEDRQAAMAHEDRRSGQGVAVVPQGPAVRRRLRRKRHLA